MRISACMYGFNGACVYGISKTNIDSFGCEEFSSFIIWMREVCIDENVKREKKGKQIFSEWYKQVIFDIF